MCDHRTQVLLLTVLYYIKIVLFHFCCRCKFTKPSDSVTGNPLVLRMVVNYSRQMSSQNVLRDIVGPLIMKVTEYTLSEILSVFDELRNNTFCI